MHPRHFHKSTCTLKGRWSERAGLQHRKPLERSGLLTCQCSEHYSTSCRQTAALICSRSQSWCPVPIVCGQQSVLISIVCTFKRMGGRIWSSVCVAWNDDGKPHTGTLVIYRARSTNCLVRAYLSDGHPWCGSGRCE